MDTQMATRMGMVMVLMKVCVLYVLDRILKADLDSMSRYTTQIGCFCCNKQQNMLQGGKDQNHAVIVSRVAPGSPADICYPKLNEGDQVLIINGIDVTQHTHEQVVQFIRSARESNTGELVLTVRPNGMYILFTTTCVILLIIQFIVVYSGDDVEPDFQYVPQVAHTADAIRGDRLQQSIALLTDAVQSGAAVTQFEQLYRRKNGKCNNER
jgi:tyrosine-protein phosphatase non-receptor type 4